MNNIVCVTFYSMYVNVFVIMSQPLFIQLIKPSMSVFFIILQAQIVC